MKKNIPHKKSKVSKLLPKNSKAASSPWTVEYIWTKSDQSIWLEIIDYNSESSKQYIIDEISDTINIKNKDSITWLNINGVHSEEIIHKVWVEYDIHPLVLEDMSNTTQRSKIEEYDEYIFMVLKIVYFSEETNSISIEQLSIIVGENYILTLQEKPGIIFNGVRERIKNWKWKIRKMWSDYLMYALTDALVDSYFWVLEKISNKIESLEEKLLISVDTHMLQEIYALKNELLFLKKSIWPLREVVNNLQKIENSLIEEHTHLYLRDVYDHTIQIIETIETFRDIISGMLDLYLSMTSNKMNEVMKVLTIFSAIFIPLTFFSGIYGMNFQHMPELEMIYAYPIWWIATIVMSIIMVIIFKKKNWL